MLGWKVFLLFKEETLTPSSILSSGTNYGKYVTFDETVETNILEFFKELA